MRLKETLVSDRRRVDTKVVKGKNISCKVDQIIQSAIVLTKEGQELWQKMKINKSTVINIKAKVAVKDPKELEITRQTKSSYNFDSVG